MLELINRYADLFFAWVDTLDDLILEVATRPSPFMLTCLNGFMCFAVFWACLCRLRLTSTETMLMPRFAFSVVLVVHVVSGLRGPILGSQVQTWWPIVFTFSTWCILLVNIRAWRHAPPPALQKNSAAMPLDSIY